MNKHKVFMPSGTIQTVLADKWEIDWSEGGTLRFFLSPNILIAAFPPGGWHGFQDISVYDRAKAAT